tara:strand:+ start:3404 stop:3913 length:510 start_codon:yes stop_codon:yes gene_type:complete
VGNYFRDYIDKVKATKKLAREKNVPIWHIPLANAMGMIILTAVYMSVYTWIAIVDIEKNFDYIPSWWNLFIDVANWLPLIYLGVLSFTVLDKVLTIFILFQAAVTKSIFNIIQKADHKIWRKTGKDSVIANKIWWVQQKWMGLDKKKRQMIMILGFIVFMIWYAYRIIT